MNASGTFHTPHSFAGSHFSSRPTFIPQLSWVQPAHTFPSAYNRGQMGYRTPNIDRIANEGTLVTDHYGQQSCIAGRAAFITGQSPMRTGILKVGLPGAKEGLSEKDPTLAELCGHRLCLQGIT